VQIYLREAIKPNSVTETQVKARYDAIVASLGENEYKTRLILVADEATGQSVLTQLKAGADFAKLARQFSKAPSAAKGGELDWVSFKLPLAEGATQGYPLAIADAIVKLPAGAVSAAPIVVGNQRYVIKVDEVRPTVVPKFEAVKPSLQAALERQELERATAHLVAGLIKNAKINQ
jgi:parvulin-like peptidyl-prolyl isomerase